MAARRLRVPAIPGSYPAASMLSVAKGRFHKLFRALRPTFEKLFRGVGRALRRAPNYDRAISMICALRPGGHGQHVHLFQQVDPTIMNRLESDLNSGHSATMVRL